MIRIKATTKDETRRVRRAANRGTFKSLNQAAATIRLIAKRSIRRRKSPGPAGQPPRTQTKRLPNSILYFVDRDKQSAIIGPSHRLIGPAGAAHERGGLFRGRRYPARPFMGPALEKAKPRIPRFWSGSVHN